MGFQVRFPLQRFKNVHLLGELQQMENVALYKMSLGFAAVVVDSLIVSRVVWEMRTK